MKTQETTIYKCEFCGKYYIRKYHAEKHEEYCYKNPRNKHICLKTCMYLEVGKGEGIRYDEDGKEYPYFIKTFKCIKTNKYMFTYKGWKNKKLDLVGLVRMPNECDSYVVGENEKVF